MNISFVGSRLRLAPMAKPSDGQFDVVMVSPDERDAFLSWLENPEVEDAPVAVETGSCAVVSRNSAPLRIGDKLSGKPQGKVTVEIEEAKQLILVPHRDAEDGATPGAEIHGP
jgi:hypothetical protein